MVMKRSIVLLLMLLLTASAAYATMPQTEGGNNGGFGKPMALPNTQLWVHDVGKVWMSITNYGFFGSQGGDINEYTGRYLLAPGVEYPGGIMTNVELTDQEVMDVVNYILNSWGNAAGTVTLEDVAAAR